MDEERAQNERDLLARNYFLVCTGAMLVLGVLLFRRGLGPWSLAPVVVGIGGTAFRFRFAPLLTLGALATTLVMWEPFESGRSRGSSAIMPTFNGSLPDWVLSVAVLAYFIAHYRLMGLTLSLLSKGGGNKEEGTGAAPMAMSSLRSGKAVSAAEMSWFILLLPVWAVLAQVFWKLVPLGPNPYDLEAPAWQGVVLSWALGLGGYLAASMLAYVLWQRRTRSESLLLLQDVAWQETWRDQRRIGRELARARLRRRRKEKS